MSRILSTIIIQLPRVPSVWCAVGPFGAFWDAIIWLVGVSTRVKACRFGCLACLLMLHSSCHGLFMLRQPSCHGLHAVMPWPSCRHAMAFMPWPSSAFMPWPSWRSCHAMWPSPAFTPWRGVQGFWMDAPGPGEALRNAACGFQ